MGTGYTRQSSATIIDAAVIEAADLNAELNLLESAFNAATGHSHDGTSGEGPQIPLTTSVTGILPIANGGTSGATAAAALSALGAGTEDSPQFTGIELGHATDTTITRSSAGILAVEGVTVPLNSITNTLTTQQIELGHATDTTIARVSAGVISVEGSNVLLASGLGSITQAYDAELAAIAGLTSAADRLPYFTGSGTAALATFTAFARTLLDDADAATMRTTLGVDTSGTAQPLDAELTALAGLTSAADSLPYFTGSGTAALTTLTSAARSILDDASVGAIATTLGLGTANSPQFTGIELGHATDTTLTRSAAGQMAIEGGTGSVFTATIELGHATDTTLSRSSAGVIAVEGVTVSLNSTGATHTAGTIELGAATDTTLSRSSAGVLAVEGVAVPLNSITNTHIALGIEVGHATDTTITRSSAGVIAVEGSAVLMASNLGQETIWVPAGSLTPRTTNGAGFGTMESTTNDVMTTYLAFDATTSEGAQVAIQMPKSWDESTVVAQFVWTHPATATNFGVTWGLRAVAYANDDALDTAFGTAAEIADTGGTTSDVYITSETAAITVAGTPAAEELVVFEVYRDPGDAGDTMAVDAYLIGVKIHYTVNALSDS